MLEDMDRTVLGDAWRWLPCHTRSMLLATATGLAELAGAIQHQDRASHQGANTPPFAAAPSSSGQPDSISTNALFLPHNLAHGAASTSSSSSGTEAGTMSVSQAVHNMALQLSESCHAVCSPLLTAMEIVSLGKTISEPFAASLQDSQYDSFATLSTDSFGADPPPESASTYLYMLLMRSYLAADMAIIVCDQASRRIHTLAADNGSVSGEIALPVNLSGAHDQLPEHPQLAPPAMGLLLMLVFASHVTLRLLWVAVMGDVAFWQEAAHIMSSQEYAACKRTLLRAPMFAAFCLLQLVASISRVSLG